MKNVLGMLKGNNIWERLENYCTLAIVAGAVFLSAGLGLSAIFEKGISAILAMTGGFITIAGTTILIFSWVAKELK